MSPSLTFLGLAKRAGKLTVGEESVKIEAKANRAKLILTAKDAGSTLFKRGDNLARMAGCAHRPLPFTKAELGALVGRGTPGILALTDRGIAGAFLEKLEKETDL